MAHTRVWGASYLTSPANSQVASQGALRIRELKLDIEERLEYDHSWIGDNDDGFHTAVTLLEQGADPSTKTDAGHIYTKDFGGVTELYYQDTAGTVTQITDSGAFSFFDTQNTWTAGQATAEVAVAEASPIVWDAADSNTFSVTLTADRTLNEPSNGIKGQMITLRVIQGSANQDELTLGGSFDKAAGLVEYYSNGSGKEDLLTFYKVGTNWCLIGLINDMRSTP